jgi:hypothetical protein
MRTFQRIARSRNTRGHAAGALLAFLCLVAAPARSGDWTPFQARTGLDLAAEAATAWAPDAALVYVENDENLDDGGASERWSYLFLSPSQEMLRFYSVRAGKIVVAENLSLKFEAPPLATQWIDSGAALQIAEEAAGGDFRRKEGGQLSNMLLMRGAFQDKDPDQTTWTLVYTAPNAPSLYVVVDASAGKVRRTWRG